MRGCGRIPGKAAGTREGEGFAKRDDVFARTGAGDAGGADLPGFRDSVGKSVPQIVDPCACDGEEPSGQVRFAAFREMMATGKPMSLRIAADKDQPSVAIEIPIEKPLPDYDLEQVEQPTPRDIDALLVSQGFRDLVDDARGVLTELVCNPPALSNTTHLVDLGLSHVPDFEITQLTGAICPSDDEVYRPGLWIVLKDRKSPAKQTLGEVAMEHARIVAHELVKRLGI